jgi:hypothetical protein
MADIQAVAVPDTSHYIGVTVNGIVYVKLEDARKLREGWDAADKRIAELEAALQQIEYLDRPQIRGQPRRKTIQEIARAALKGKGNDPAT